VDPIHERFSFGGNPSSDIAGSTAEAPTPSPSMSREPRSQKILLHEGSSSTATFGDLGITLSFRRFGGIGTAWVGEVRVSVPGKEPVRMVEGGFTELAGRRGDYSVSVLWVDAAARTAEILVEERARGADR
jgi:hypothetical protein